MLYQKKGMPEENELVLCDVTSVRYNSVFVKLDEYNKSGMIHISEISPGRIRNIRDFVVEGKKIVCKILRIDRSTGNIDLSLRRVNENQRKNKVNELKQEQLAEKIIEFVAKQNKQETKTLYDTITRQLDHEPIYPFFYGTVEHTQDIKDLKLPAKVEKDLQEAINQRIKKAEVEIKGTLKLSSPEPNGVEIIKEALQKAQSDSVAIRYAGAGAFSVIVTADDYKAAEKILKKSTEAAAKSINGKGLAEFTRLEK